MAAKDEKNKPRLRGPDVTKAASWPDFSKQAAEGERWVDELINGEAEKKES